MTADFTDTEWPNVTHVTEEEQLIIPRWDLIQESMEWARQRPESYKVYTAGIITYNTGADLTMFLVKWS